MNKCYLILLLFVGGCIPNPMTYAPPRFTKESKNGAIAGSISLIKNKKYFDSYTIFFKKAASDHKTEHSIHIAPIHSVSNKVKADYFIGNALVFQFLVMLLPGEYEFTQIKFFHKKTLVFETLRSKGHFSLPFTVTPAEISYVGDIIIDYEQYERSSHLVTWKDNSARELSVFQERIPAIDWTTFKNRTITKGYFSYPDLIEFEE